MRLIFKDFLALKNPMVFYFLNICGKRVGVSEILYFNLRFVLLEENQLLVYWDEGRNERPLKLQVVKTTLVTINHL